MSQTTTQSPLRGPRGLPRWIRRKRIHRFWQKWLQTLPFLFAASTFLCLSLWFFPLSLGAAGLGWLGLVLVSGGVALFAAVKSVPELHVLRDLDAGLQTEDLAITVGDPSVEPQWRELLHGRLQPHLASIRVSHIWPLRSSPLQRVWIAACLLMGTTIILTATTVRPGTEPPVTVAPESTVALEEMLDDWQEVAPDLQSEEFQAILREVEQLQAEANPAEQTPSERMEMLSKIEAIVERHRRGQADSSIAEHADDLAALLESVEGMSGTAAALRRGEFSTAGQSLEEIVAAMMRGEELPPGATSEEFQRRAEALSEVASEKGNAELSESLKNLSEAAERNDSSQWCESAGSLGACMNQEGARSLAARMMQAQLDQLEAQKLALARKNSPQAASLASLLRMQGRNAAGLGAGTETGGDPFGDSTQPNGERETLALAGTLGEGDSTRKTTRSSEAPTEAARVGGQASFEEYQMLSTQAIHDESLPLVHRETIRRYFERIRPKRPQD